MIAEELLKGFAHQCALGKFGILAGSEGINELGSKELELVLRHAAAQVGRLSHEKK
jgi:hypothetical protein